MDVDQIPDFKTITEGKVKVKVPDGKQFYDPAQQFNRELTMLLIRAFFDRGRPVKKKGDGIRVLDTFASSGLKAIRLARELEFVDTVVANAPDPHPVQLIQNNLELNAAKDKNVRWIVEPHQGTAQGTMYKFLALGKPFDVIDLDCNGSATPYFDIAVQSVADRGLVFVTCTDLSILCAASPGTCFARYGGLPVKGEACHEAV